MLRHWQAARNIPLIKKRYVTDRLPGMSFWLKNVTSLTRGAEWPFRCLDCDIFLSVDWFENKWIYSNEFIKSNIFEGLWYMFVRRLVWSVSNKAFQQIQYPALCTNAWHANLNQFWKQKTSRKFNWIFFWEFIASCFFGCRCSVGIEFAGIDRTWLPWNLNFYKTVLVLEIFEKIGNVLIVVLLPTLAYRVSWDLQCLTP